MFGPTGRGTAGLKPQITVISRNGNRLSAPAAACSAGCYQAVLPTTQMPAHVAISFNDGSHLGFTLPRRGPTPEALAVVRGAADEYKHIHSMVTYERLGSSPTQVVYTTYYAVAPDRLRFNVRGEGSSIIIGDKRWDREKRGAWQESAQAPIKPIAPYWAPLIQDATILGSATVEGRPVWVVSFADPQTPGFFTVWVDKSNNRTLELKMTAAVHFMHHLYTGFNAPISVTPPKTG